MDPFIGEIKMMSFDFAPKGWAACDGQLMSISQNQALFSILGTTYGGDGINTFALPSLKGRVPIHADPAWMPAGSGGGEEFHTLTVPELPNHGHQASGSSVPLNQATPVNNFWTGTGDKNLYAPSPNDYMAANALQPSGGNAHENRPPFQVLNFCVALVGIYPSRP